MYSLILNYPTLPYPTLPYPTLPYPTLPYPTLPYPTLPYPTLPYPIIIFSTHIYIGSISSCFARTTCTKAQLDFDPQLLSVIVYVSIISRLTLKQWYNILFY